MNPTPGGSARGVYEERVAEIRNNFELHGDGLQAAAARSALVDGLVMQFWQHQVTANPKLTKGVAVCAIGGFGRGKARQGADSKRFAGAVGLRSAGFLCDAAAGRL